MSDLGAGLKPFERQLHEVTVAALRASLGASGLARVVVRGAAITTDEAVDYALGNGPNRQTLV